MVASIPEDRPLTAPIQNAAVAALSTRGRIFAIVGSSSGNLVEWYDFYTYAFTSIYFAGAFFPKGDRTSQLLATAGIFAVGFLMRPIGSWVFGRIADRHGRRTSMVLSVLMMCAGSLAIAVLPTYDTIGTAAGVLLLLARLVQGLSVGGEYGTSATYMSEVAARGNRGFLASFQYVTLIGGQLLASLVVVVLELTLSGDEIRAWGWRVPFVIGAVAAVVALYLRRSLIETSSEDVRKSKDAGTIRALLQHPRAFMTVLGFTAGGSLIFYTYTTYMQKYLVNTAHMATSTVSLVMTAVLFVYMVVQPLFGALSDRIGRRNNMLAFGLLTTLSTVPLLGAIGTVTNPFAAFGLILCGLAAVSFYTAISGLVKAEMFPMSCRALGVGLSYAIANAVFGGSAEYVALWLKDAGIEGWFAWYVTALCAIAFIVAILMPDSRSKSMIEDN
ncbi:MHS family alpha-ketoglutarate permease-like MFS transporter [Inquilinus ginsengisoli]|uniref:MHS family alpha-ketoglutarate permease-like MFS transporter n=1 Tax=Inquilinus ginsengisoli TaxID=363840 RepID=A0ABU1K148_9PROT|nr:MFS family transporter [Inquilinus ginsengisoli]MDR6293999.1 MHS family alpha-ketoglutarate permease-like MFS transporter [Inquilinus ginsengisoli]